MQLENQRSGRSFYYFNFERKWHFKVKESMHFCWAKISTLIKTKRNRKWKIPHSFREMNLLLQLIKESQINVKLWWVGAHERNKRKFFVQFILFGHGSASLQLFPVVWIFLRSLGIICYNRLVLLQVLHHKNHFTDWCLMNSQPTFLFLTYFNSMIHGHIIKRR